MKKRIVLIILSLLMIFTTALPAFTVSAASPDASVSGNIDISLNIDKTNVRKGQTFFLTFTVKNSTNLDLSTLEFSITYASADFEFCNAITNNDTGYKKIAPYVVDATTNRIEIRYEADSASAAFMHGTSTVGELSLKMKYIGSGYSVDTASTFSITNITALSEKDFTYTGVDYAFSNSQITTDGATIVLNAISNVNTLSSISLSVGGRAIELEPAFHPNITDYVAYIEYSTGSISASFPRTDSYGSALVHNFDQHTITIGSNKFYIIVTAENGDVRTYNIDLHILPQGMTVQEYKDYLASLETVSSQPEEEEPVVTETDTETVESAVSSELPVLDVEEEEPPVSETDIEGGPEKSGNAFIDFLNSIHPAILITAIGLLVVLVTGGFAAGFVAHKRVQREKMYQQYEDYYDGYDSYDGYYEDEYYDDNYYDEGYYEEGYYDDEEY